MKFFAKSLLLIFPLVFLPIVHAEINNNKYPPIAQARWKTRPNISISQLDCESKLPLDFVAEWQVSKQGEIKAIHLLKSSDNPLLNQQLMKQLGTAEFYPFTKNGEPIERLVKLPIRIVCD